MADKSDEQQEKLFKYWVQLSAEVRQLGGVVQNPVENLTADNKEFWHKRVQKINKKFEWLVKETAKIIADE